MSLYLHNRTFIKQKSSSQVIWKITVLELPNLAKPDAEMRLTQANMPTIERNEPTKPVMAITNPDCTIQCIRIKVASIAYAGQTKQ